MQEEQTILVTGGTGSFGHTFVPMLHLAALSMAFIAGLTSIPWRNNSVALQAASPRLALLR